MTDRPFLVPDLGEGLTDVTITSWYVAVGDVVELNQPLCTVETAKAEVEIPSPYAGRITEVCGAPGEVLEVGTLLARIEVPDGDTVGRAVASPNEPRRPVLVGYGTDDSFDTSRRAPAGSYRPKAKPKVRKLAADLGVDLAALTPGPAGVVTREAVLAAAGRRREADYEVVPVAGVHAVMAQRMALAHSQIPDAAASLQVDGTRLLALCRRLTEAGATAISPFALTLRLTVLALGRHPAVNATWAETADGAQVHRHRAVHLGIAVAAPRGLLVPVLADAQDKTTGELADAVDRLIRDARAGTLAPAQLSGSTFTVSNFGALGMDSGIPVINPPEAAILGMGALKPRPAVVDDAVAVRPQMTLTCVFDHRVLDGAQAAGFLTELAGLIETPDAALGDP
ncbi:dihydrolipoamide acetyltransferase family protein [Mycobacterium sp. 1274756.6]|uniref:dihydrolipoamide acetyltransferase family protein n=1 Tax=Mycobacterium sp. 1274756.6 TaxID=1834076 RepID=UPI0007FF7317|nr:dihydrolipoamide acetyltransferase family protein [Mycobacterium sp. 1274756.6]OBJ72308.1 branched-chain alpha-keto acid dehydrogenase subunit E2 [Mycobacterium sp. 1274756.6]